MPEDQFNCHVKTLHDVMIAAMHLFELATKILGVFGCELRLKTCGAVQVAAIGYGNWGQQEGNEEIY